MLRLRSGGRRFKSCRAHPFRIVRPWQETNVTPNERVATAPQALTLKTTATANWWQSVWIRRALLLIRPHSSPPARQPIRPASYELGRRGRRREADRRRPTHGRSGSSTPPLPDRRAQGAEEGDAPPRCGWADGYTVNGRPRSRSTRERRTGSSTSISAHSGGSPVTFWLSLQINPTTIGRHRQNVCSTTATS